MMQHLMILAANQRLPEPGPAREAVTREDARDAVLQLAALIDLSTADGRLSPDQGLHGAAMLMLIREYIQPLPAVPGDNGADQVTPDLVKILKELRRVGGEAGLQG